MKVIRMSCRSIIIISLPSIIIEKSMFDWCAECTWPLGGLLVDGCVYMVWGNG